MLTAEKIRFGVVLPEHTFLLYASCLLFLQLGEELLSMTTDLDRRLGADVLCKTPGSLSILSHRTVGHSLGVQYVPRHPPSRSHLLSCAMPSHIA